LFADTFVLSQAARNPLSRFKDHGRSGQIQL
jgi:hypothetical protein